MFSSYRCLFHHLEADMGLCGHWSRWCS